jgi:hypothetical protein
MRSIRNVVSLLVVAGVVVAGLAGVVSGAEPKDKKHWWNGEPWTDGEPFHYQGAVAKGATVEVHGINGGIDAVLATGSEVVVDALRRGKKDDPDEVKIEVTKKPDGGLMICARYPTPSGDLNDCEGGQNVQNCDVTVEFKIKVPAGVRFEPTTVNGGIEAKGLKGPVDAVTVNGGIEISTTGAAEARTVNGGITATVGKMDGDLEFETTNGGIEITLPAKPNLDLDARTANGTVNTDLPVTVSGKVKRNHLRGQIGSGGPHLRLSTVNGDIDLNVE